MSNKKVKRIHYNKLIRDRVPITINERGYSCKTSRLSLKRFKQELLKKVDEEASALPNLNKKQEVTNELADIIAIINEIKKVFNIKDKDIKIELQKNFKKKGGFKKRLFLYWSGDINYKTNERRYPNK
ncbi:hypothetical protein KKG41_06985 [Patescibacteria group bacterium]|nr:hypothetical protein [Patescibacteria group bacterium]MBU1890465.1 hypothetical protein [Patescibacteria group bacterium]